MKRVLGILQIHTLDWMNNVDESTSVLLREREGYTTIGVVLLASGNWVVELNMVTLSDLCRDHYETKLSF